MFEKSSISDLNSVVKFFFDLTQGKKSTIAGHTYGQISCSLYYCLRLIVFVCCFLMLFGTITFIQLFNNLVPLVVCSISPIPQANTLALLSFAVLVVLHWSCHVNAVYFGCTAQLLLLFLFCKKGFCCCHCQAGVAYWCHCCHCCCFSSVPNQVFLRLILPLCLFIWILIYLYLFVALIACVPELHCFGIKLVGCPINMFSLFVCVASHVLLHSVLCSEHINTFCFFFFFFFAFWFSDAKNPGSEKKKT